MGQEETKPAASVQTTTTDELNEHNAESMLMASFAESDDSQPATDGNDDTTQQPSDVSNDEDALDTSTTETSEDNNNTNDDEQSDSKNETDDDPFVKSAKGWQKRVNKLTAQKKAKDDEIELLKREIQELKSGRSMAEKQQPKPAKNPVDDINDLEKLDEFTTRTRVERDKVLEMLSSDAPDFEIGNEIYTREQILGYLKILNSDLDEAIPARKKSLSHAAMLQEKSKENDALIAKNFPDFKEGSAEDEWIKEQLSDQFFEANKKILLHYAWKGLTLSQVEAKYKGKSATTSTKKVLPPAPASSASSPRISASNVVSKDGSLNRDFAAKLLFQD